jgi:hypothetical protein
MVPFEEFGLGEGMATYGSKKLPSKNADEAFSLHRLH